MGFPLDKFETVIVQQRAHSHHLNYHEHPALSFQNACCATYDTSQDVKVCFRYAFYIQLRIILLYLGVLKIALLKTILGVWYHTCIPQKTRPGVPIGKSYPIRSTYVHINPCSPEGFSQTYFPPLWIINTEGHITLNLLPVYRYGHPLSIDTKISTNH